MRGRCLLLLLLSLFALPAMGADPCPVLSTQTNAPDVATRIAAFACKENHYWYRSFIDADGRPSGTRVYEAENAGLADGIEAWRHVAAYWNETGLLPSSRPGALDCAYAATTPYPSPGCRSFVMDTPWSAAFISWVMRRAGVPAFRGSGSHITYVREAYKNSSGSPYLVQDPRSAKPAVGDMLCSVRSSNRLYGFGDLAGILSQANQEGLAMHCDVVVGASAGNLAYLIGGNVQQAVTLRMLRLAPNGYFANLPTRTLEDPECSPDAPATTCDLNRTNWAVMLKLKNPTELSKLPPALPLLVPGAPTVPANPAQPQCCVNCVVGSGIPRCPVPGAAQSPAPLPGQ